jgi:2-phospho-L-lactate guanylyltransferase (CobY/MobA/RfbA family)
VATYVVPYRRGGKTRLGDSNLADAMMLDVVDACRAAGASDVFVVRAGGGQGEAIAAQLRALHGAVTIVNADLPCATADELRELSRAAPSLVAATDGTTNAIAVADAREFVPLYGVGSAGRFAQALDARVLGLESLVDDVDTWDDLERVRDRVGGHTRRYLASLACV